MVPERCCMSAPPVGIDDEESMEIPQPSTSFPFPFPPTSLPWSHLVTRKNAVANMAVIEALFKSSRDNSWEKP